MRGVRVSRTSIVITLLIVFGFMAYLQAVKREPLEARPSKNTRNSENELLLTRTPVEQARLLGEKSGKGCLGTDAFFMGLEADKTGYWSLRCADGREFMVTTSPRNERVILECKLLHSLRNGMTCFAPLRKE